MTWATEQELPAMQKIVLLMMANRTNHDTGLCFPSHDLLAKECGMAKRSLIDQINKLESAGLIEVMRSANEKGMKNVNRYRLNLHVKADGKEKQELNEIGSAGAALGSAGAALGGSAGAAHKPVTIEPVIEPITTTTARVDEKSIDPVDALMWVAFFVNLRGYQFHEAQTVSTMMMFREWVSAGVTVDDVELAEIDVRRSLGGDRPDTPTYYRNFVKKLMLEKQKSQITWHGQSGSFRKQRGNYDAKHSKKTEQPKSNSSFAEKYGHLFAN